MVRSPEWPDHPVTHEINTAVWLTEVADRHGAPVTLADVPAAEWDAVVPEGIDVVWLMGVWSRSAAGRDIALQNPQLRDAWSRALPDWTDPDVAGSPYCIREYEPDEMFGGWSGVDAAREQLRRRGALLLLDWVPNHVGPDSSWLRTSLTPSCGAVPTTWLAIPRHTCGSTMRSSPVARTHTSRRGRTSSR